MLEKVEYWVEKIKNSLPIIVSILGTILVLIQTIKQLINSKNEKNGLQTISRESASTDKASNAEPNN